MVSGITAALQPRHQNASREVPNEHTKVGGGSIAGMMANVAQSEWLDYLQYPWPMDHET